MTEGLAIPRIGGPRLRRPLRRLFFQPGRLAVFAGTLLVILFTVVNWTVELLWFRSLGYEGVFWRLRLAKLAMFTAAFVPVFSYVLLNLYTLRRLTDLQSLFGSGSHAGASQNWRSQPGKEAARPRADLTLFILLLSATTAVVFGIAYYGCLPSALVGQNGWLEEGRISGSS